MTSKASVCDGCTCSRPRPAPAGTSSSMTSGSSCTKVIRSPVWTCVIELSATRDGREDLHLVTLGYRGVQPVAEADVLAADVDVDEAPQAAVAVGEALAQLLVLGVQRLEDLADGG